jgi:hypothetical protein
MEAAKTKLQRDMMAVSDAQGEIQAIKARTKSGRAPVLAALVPADDALNMAGMETLRIAGFEKFRMPAFMAEEFHSAMRGFPTLEGPHLAFRKFNNWWKTLATWLFPGFHVRNIEGAWFNNWLGGVQVREYITSSRVRYAERERAAGAVGKWLNRKLAEVEPDLVKSMKFGEPTGYIAGKRIDDLTYGDLATLTNQLNLNSSNGRAFAEAMLGAEARTVQAAKSAAQLTKRSYVQRIAKPYTKAMKGLGTGTENVFRTAAFVRGLRNGQSVMESRAFAMMRHGDYEDLTDFEYKVVRDLIPFYKWMRTNTPFQIHQLLENPAKLMAVSKLQKAVFEAQGLDYETEKHRMPEWMTKGFLLPYAKGTGPGGMTTYETVMLDLPMSDLFMGTREFFSSFLPTVRPLLESYVIQQQVFTGRPLTGEQKPMNDIFTPVAGILSSIGLVSTGPDGQPYMDDRVENLLGVLPLYSRFKTWLYEDETSVSKRHNAVASAVFGFQLRPVDEQAMTAAELDFYYGQVLPAVEYLRDIGHSLPTTDDIASTVGTTDAVLRSIGIEPGPVGAAA